MIFKGSKDIKGISRLEIISAHFQTFFFVEGFLDLRIDLQNGMLPPPPNIRLGLFVFVFFSFGFEHHHHICYFVWYAQTF